MAQERLGRGLLTLPLEIDGGGVEVVDAVGDGVVDQFVDAVLVHDVAAFRVLFHLPTHAAVAEDGYTVPAVRVGPHLHRAGALVGPGRIDAGLGGRFLASRDAQRGGSGSGGLQEFSSIHFCVLLNR